MARQFNLIPPIAEQCEYNVLQRDKVEIQMPEMYHKIGNHENIFTVFVVRFCEIFDKAKESNSLVDLMYI